MLFKSKGRYDVHDFIYNMCDDLSFLPPSQMEVMEHNNSFATRLEDVFIERFKKDHPERYRVFLETFPLTTLG